MDTNTTRAKDLFEAESFNQEVSREPEALAEDKTEDVVDERTTFCGKVVLSSLCIVGIGLLGAKITERKELFEGITSFGIGSTIAGVYCLAMSLWLDN